MTQALIDTLCGPIVEGRLDVDPGTREIDGDSLLPEDGASLLEDIRFREFAFPVAWLPGVRIVDPDKRNRSVLLVFVHPILRPGPLV